MKGYTMSAKIIEFGSHRTVVLKRIEQLGEIANKAVEEFEFDEDESRLQPLYQQHDKNVLHLNEKIKSSSKILENFFQGSKACQQ